MKDISKVLEFDYFNRAFELLKNRMSLDIKEIDSRVFYAEGKHNLDIIELYNNKIKGNVFLNYPNIFFSKELHHIQGNNCIRKINFLSFELELLYHSLGLYIQEHIQDGLESRKEFASIKKNIQTYSGKGFSENIQCNTHWSKDWIDFSKGVKDSVKKELGLHEKQKILIKLDIKNFFHSLEHEVILNEINKSCIKNKISNEHQQFIKDFLFFIMKTNKGLPITNEGVVSHYLANLCLMSLDSFICKSIPDFFGKYHSSFEYFRYVDDVYIILSIEDDCHAKDIHDQCSHFISKVNNFSISNLKLSLNLEKTNTSIITLENYEDELLETNLNSSMYLNENPENINATLIEIETPSLILPKILKILNDTYQRFVNGEKNIITKKELTILKQINKKQIIELLKKESNKNTMNNFLKKMDISYLERICSTSFTLFYISCPIRLVKLKEYVLKNLPKKNESNNFIFIMSFIITSEDITNQIFNFLKINDKKEENHILEYYLLNYLNKISNLPKQINKNISWLTDDILSRDEYIQIQLYELIKAESSDTYNLAFNHLINLVQLVIKNILQSYDIKNEQLNNNKKIGKYLIDLDLISSCNYLALLQIGELRNSNGISHAGDTSGINRAIYYNNKKKIEEIVTEVIANHY